MVSIGRVTLENYVENAMRTECDNDVVLGRLSMGTTNRPAGDPVVQSNFAVAGIRMIHASLGINNELGEFEELCYEQEPGPDAALKSREELGDMCWYLAMVCDVFGFDFANMVRASAPLEDVLFSEVEVPLSWMTQGAGKIAEHVKKHVFYGKEFQAGKVRDGLRSVLRGILSFAGPFDFEKDVLAANIAKLKARFPERFTEHDALNRDKGVEYKAMEDDTK